MVKQLEDQERVEAEREAAEQAAPAHHHQEQPPRKNLLRITEQLVLFVLKLCRKMPC